jgi:hypothetical protein
MQHASTPQKVCAKTKSNTFTTPNFSSPKKINLINLICYSEIPAHKKSNKTKIQTKQKIQTNSHNNQK